MSSIFMIYGANGFLGEFIAREALKSGLKPILGGRDAVKIKQLATELGVESRVFNLTDQIRVEQALKGVSLVMNCAGPYKDTSKSMVDACLKTGTHYMDLTAELPVFEAIAARDQEAKAKSVMLLPGIGFYVVATDCLAAHLKKRLPTASQLTLAFQNEGSTGLPPGTQRTWIELIPIGNCVRVHGELVVPKVKIKKRKFDFGNGPIETTRLTWGDLFTAYYNTAIPNIEVYAALPKALNRQAVVIAYLRPLFSLPFMRKLLLRTVKPGPSLDMCFKTFAHVRAEVEDNQGRKAAAILHGPEATLLWTTLTALAGIKKVLNGTAPAGYQTPAMAFGPDFVMECEGVTRIDLNG